MALNRLLRLVVGELLNDRAEEVVIIPDNHTQWIIGHWADGFVLVLHVLPGRMEVRRQKSYRDFETLK